MPLLPVLYRLQGAWPRAAHRSSSCIAQQSAHDTIALLRKWPVASSPLLLQECTLRTSRHCWDHVHTCSTKNKVQGCHGTSRAPCHATDSVYVECLDYGITDAVNDGDAMFRQAHGGNVSRFLGPSAQSQSAQTPTTQEGQLTLGSQKIWQYCQSTANSASFQY